MDFKANDYGVEVARILEMEGAGRRAMPLAGSTGASAAARDVLRQLKPREAFPEAQSPEGALSGMYLYFSCLDEAHSVAQDLDSPEGSFWHAITHRREPDAENAAYWFRRAGKHPVFPALREEARFLRFDTGREWDPFEFIEFCGAARARPGSEEELIAAQVQLVEWQLLFDYCASPHRREEKKH